MSELNKEMEKPEFLAALKLVSGEEILAVITSVHDDNGDYLIVENPIEVEEVMLQGNKQGAKVSPWMKFSREEEFIIPKDKVITVVEVDTEVQVFYAMSLRRLNGDIITDATGRIATVEEARAKLDNIFNK
jgi:hypothetical protein|tara:strand:- start:2598 stop:2990 length:393 start_codon:yes stop_codon:yes gene_type:complete